MVFPSVPVYLDPTNWNQQQAQHPGSSGGGGGGGGGGEFHHLQPGAALPIRPASTADRARLAKVPQPEQPLKCPRCDSANTKFCYFNNYSLSQPRHFCKTCRRYWTRGGALRNVPVGGGCRRNKRSKAGGGSSSKPQPTTATDRPSSSSTGAIAATISAPPQLPFMGCLQTIPEYTGLNMGFSFQGMQPVEVGEFDRYQVGGSSSLGLDQWRIQQIQQFPFLGGLEAGGQAPVQGLYPFDGEGFLGQVHGKGSNAGLITQMASVKMEDNSQGLNMARQYLGGSRNDQFWGGSSGGGGSNGGSNGGGWMTDLSGFNSSSSNNLM